MVEKSVLRDGDKPLFDRHYVNARNAILLTDARALPYAFSAGSFYGDQFQYTLQENGEALLITDHKNFAFSNNARRTREGALLRFLPNHSGGQPFSGNLRLNTEPVSGPLYANSWVRDLTITKVSELAGLPVVVNAMYPQANHFAPYAATNLMHDDSYLDILNASMFSDRTWFIATPDYYLYGDTRTSDGWSIFYLRWFDNLTFRSDGSGEMPELSGTFRWRLEDSRTLFVFDTRRLHFLQSSIRRCKHSSGPSVCTQIASTDEKGLTSSFRLTAVEGRGIPFSPAEFSFLISASPSILQPLRASWYEFKSDGTLVVRTTRDRDRNGVLESSEVSHSPAVWTLQDGKVVITYYRSNGGTGSFCPPPESGCVKTDEANHLRLLARVDGDTSKLLLHFQSSSRHFDQSNWVLLRPATQPPIAL